MGRVILYISKESIENISKDYLANNNLFDLLGTNPINLDSKEDPIFILRSDVCLVIPNENVIITDSILTFEEAINYIKTHYEKGRLFEHQGRTYTSFTQIEFESLTSEAKSTYFNDIISQLDLDSRYYSNSFDILEENIILDDRDESFSEENISYKEDKYNQIESLFFEKTHLDDLTIFENPIMREQNIEKNHIIESLYFDVLRQDIIQQNEIETNQTLFAQEDLTHIGIGINQQDDLVSDQNNSQEDFGENQIDIDQERDDLIDFIEII